MSRSQLKIRSGSPTPRRSPTNHLPTPPPSATTGDFRSLGSNERSTTVDPRRSKSSTTNPNPSSSTGTRSDSRSSKSDGNTQGVRLVHTCMGVDEEVEEGEIVEFCRCKPNVREPPKSVESQSLVGRKETGTESVVAAREEGRRDKCHRSSISDNEIRKGKEKTASTIEPQVVDTISRGNDGGRSRAADERSPQTKFKTSVRSGNEKLLSTREEPPPRNNCNNLQTERKTDTPAHTGSNPPGKVEGGHRMEEGVLTSARVDHQGMPQAERINGKGAHTPSESHPKVPDPRTNLQTSSLVKEESRPTSDGVSLTLPTSTPPILKGYQTHFDSGLPSPADLECGFYSPSACMRLSIPPCGLKSRLPSPPETLPSRIPTKSKSSTHEPPKHPDAIPYGVDQLENPSRTRVRSGILSPGPVSLPSPPPAQGASGYSPPTVKETSNAEVILPFSWSTLPPLLGRARPTSGVYPIPGTYQQRPPAPLPVLPPILPPLVIPPTPLPLLSSVRSIPLATEAVRRANPRNKRTIDAFAYNDGTNLANSLPSGNEDNKSVKRRRIDVAALEGASESVRPESSKHRATAGTSRDSNPRTRKGIRWMLNPETPSEAAKVRFGIYLVKVKPPRRAETVSSSREVIDLTHLE